MNIRKELEEFVPICEQEEVDKECFLKFLDTFDDVLTRENVFGHMTASSFVINHTRDKMVVVYHLINDGWMYPGGHADGEEDLLSVALREVEEETGLHANVLDNNIFGIQTLPTVGHRKHGKYVASHTHYDVIYLFEADDISPLSFRKEESSGVKWISFNEAEGEDVVDFIRPIHKKLIKKLRSR